MTRLIIFDFDGVIADSEILANTVLAEFVSEHARPMSVDETMATFMGKRFADVIATIEELSGRLAPASLPADVQQRTLDRFARDLVEVPGFRAYLDAFSSLPCCIASSSSPDRLDFCVKLLGLDGIFGRAGKFGPNVFSASQVERGKPHPDVFLLAASRMGVAPCDALVIEDSESGVRGAVAAGMTVIGLLTASHIRDGHGQRLLRAGAHAVAKTFDEAAIATRAWLAGALPRADRPSG